MSDPLPLDGVRVLDLADHRAALGGRLLADLGADVLLIEPPGGCGTRAQAPFVDDQPGPDRSFQHLYFNVNKRSTVLDWHSDGGWERLLALAMGADILIETGTPGALDISALMSANPHLIVVSATPYGQTGSKRLWRATDLTASAAGGLLQVAGDRADPPAHSTANPAYMMTGLTVASSAMTALHGRDRTSGQPGVQIDISMQKATSFQLVQTSNPCVWRWRKEIPVRPALSQAFECADGKWMACNVSPNKLAEFIQMLDDAGVEHDLDPDNWQVVHRGDRAAWQHLENPLQYLAGELAAVIPRQRFLDQMWAAPMPAMPTMRFSEFAESEHYPNSGQFHDLEVPALNTSLSFSRSALDPVQSPLPIRPAPRLGQDNPEIASTARQWSDDEIDPYPAMPLAGIRVLDLTWVAAGPLSARLLANFGAEVLKVESGSLRMDPLRVQPIAGGKFQPDLPDLFNDANTGKKSVTLDLSSEQGKELLRQLAAKCDVLIENYSGGSLARMGFPYEELREINPRLIVVHLPGVGGESPWRPLRSLGNLLMAASGMNFLMGFPGRAPRGIGTAFPDFTTPHVAATAILSALRARERTGEGREIELSQLSSTVALIGAAWMEFARRGTDPVPPGNTDPNMSPHGVFPSAGDDQWVALALETDAQWPAFAELIGRPEWAGVDELQSVEARRKRSDEIEQAIHAWSSGLSKWEAAEQLQALGIAANAVEDLRDMMDIDEHFRDHYQRVEQPSEPGFGIWIDGAPWEFAHLEPRTLERAPMLGEHNDYVLGEILGLSDGTIAELIAGGVVG